MTNDSEIRKHILKLLRGGMAYMPFDEVVADFPEKHINTIFPKGTYSFWHLLEHIRITQKGILDFMIDPKYIEPEWPKDYWPASGKKASRKNWEKSISQFKKDLKALQKMIMDPKIELLEKVPKGSGQTYLREFFLVADHNSYHLGEFSIMRQVLETWPKSRKS